MKSKMSRVVQSLLAIITFFMVWEIASRFLQKTLLPSPILVFRQFPVLFHEKESWLHLEASFYRVFLGLFFSVVGGFLLGLGMGTFKKIATFSDALVYFTYPIPKMALLPIVMLLGGLGDQSKIIMIVLIVLPQVTIAVRDAIRDIPKNYYDVYRTLKASKLQCFWAITLPTTLPAIFSSVRVSLGTALSILFFTENYGTEYGLGYFIMDSWTRMDYPSMYGGILVLAICGFLLFLTIDLITHYLFRWRKN